MNKCQAMHGFTRCNSKGFWTLTLLTEQIDTCGIHIGEAFNYLLQSCGNAVEGDLSITIHYNESP